MKTYVAKFPNGKMYIGATTRTVEKRKEEHRDSSTRVDNKFYRAIRKYGFESIEFREIKEHDTKEQMFESEKILIERHKTNINGYNTTSGGEGCSDIEYTDEIRQRISDGQKKRFSNPEEVRKTSEATKKWHLENPDKSKDQSEKRALALRSDENRKRASEKQNEYLKNNPTSSIEKGKKLSDNFYKNPELRMKLGAVPVRVFKDNNEVAVFISVNAMCDNMSLNKGNVGAFFKGKRNHVHGYTFEKDDTIEVL